MKRTDKRSELIRVGREIIGQRGFNSASLNDILTTAGVPKGSFYYYFASKEDFGVAIIDDFALQYQTKLKHLLEDEQFSPLTRLRNFFESKITEMETSNCTDGCLIGNLAQELSAQNELFRDRLNQVFADWEEYFARCLRAAYETGEIDSDRNLDDLARFVLSSWEGAILQAKVTKSVVPMQTFVKILFHQVLGKSTSS
ncbi:TetR/AcrR family transcriptional regulator [Rivularia sp. UHCC 0363]|uniref:TetR/AcrR family transcriptional regulator n=1 Tax=Rivularia sp. UHCC 0363 TaxID=3110244 RepID=UPI002B20CA16|nr:TetR family transcriptional regulator C-terminal domain-containing protein [Rivularia sp. UHCC 0363]MEA5594519.1 TetR family transcriptional regulator C-terminal domain-containing protein [Rivularia sp. UHCC 0363]